MTTVCIAFYESYLSMPNFKYIREKMGPKKAKKGGPQSPGEETKGGGEKMTELDKEWYLIQIKSLGNKINFCLCQKIGYETTYGI